MGALLVCLLGDSLAVGLLLLWFPLLLVLDPSFSGAEAKPALFYRELFYILLDSREAKRQ